MTARKFALAAAFIFAGTAAFAAISPETRTVIDTFLATQQYERAEVRVGLSQIKVEMISNGQKVEVILNKLDGTELKRETEAADILDDNTPGVVIRERNRDFVRVGAGGVSPGVVSSETMSVIDTFLATQQYERAEVRVGLSQIKVEMISNGQKVEVILNKLDGTELKRETEAASIFDDNTPGVFIRERNRDFLRVDDDSNDDDEDGDDSDDNSSDDDSDDNSGGSDDSDDSNDDNGGDRDGSDDSDDDSDDDNGDDDNSDD